MTSQRLVLRATWSNRFAGTVSWVVGAIGLVVVGVVLLGGWTGVVVGSLGVAVAVRTLFRWWSASVVCTPGQLLYRRSFRRVAVPFEGVAAVTVRPVPFSRARGRGIAIRPDRPLANLPVPLVGEADGARFERWMAEHHPEVPVNPSGAWEDRFGRWHLDLGGIDVYGLLQVGLRPLVAGSASIRVETDDDGSRAVRRDAASGDLAELGPTRVDRRDAVADAVDMFRHALADSS